MNAAQHVRDASTLRAAQYRYASAHEWWSEREQLYIASGMLDEAAMAHEQAVIALRAYIAESDDPEPEELR